MDSKILISEMNLSNKIWYRVWSNGWIEQGGNLGVVSGSVTVTFPKPFKDNNYTFLISGSNVYQYSPSDTWSKTSMRIDANAGGGRTYYACGF